MVNDHPLHERLEAIDGRDYGAHPSLRDVHRFECFDLDIDQVPSDRGVTVIIGGGYHGKSTLLVALAAGVYDHMRGMDASAA